MNIYDILAIKNVNCIGFFFKIDSEGRFFEQLNKYVSDFILHHETFART